MIDHDADRTLGRYPKAAAHIRDAGFGRLRMGELMFADGNFAQAAADWLSAAACFYLATDLERMREAFDRVQKLDQEGKIPPERRDIHAALKEREEQIKVIEQRLAEFELEYSRVVSGVRTANDTGDFLLGRVRELPGLPKLHALIAIQANRLGQLPLAIEHLEWAEKFDPGNPNLGALRVRLLHASGKTRQAIQLGREILTVHPEMVHLRVYLAQASASQVDAVRSDWEEAIELLRPLTEGSSADVNGRLLALGLTATLWHGLGHETEYRRLLNSFDQFAQTIQSPAGKGVVSEVRRMLPHLFPNPGSNGAATSALGTDHFSELDSALRVFEQLVPLAGAAA
jgi:tetratricopeptide (TPR) repeat protein